MRYFLILLNNLDGNNRLIVSHDNLHLSYKYGEQNTRGNFEYLNCANYIHYAVAEADFLI